ncbi:MAG: LacI family transcriptional regulator [Clostridiales bacterium]|jgi:LacI family transcriptional regulator|nr:LacI family transcriptional regulator [Clostridiales bacterium]
MNVGIKDIAKAAGVSKSTVSNALNGKKNVSDETKKMILDLCQELNYYPNAAGRSLKMSESRAILFNFSDFDRSFYLKIIEGIHDFASGNDFDLIICTSKSCEKYMRNSMTDGAIILDFRMENETLLRVARENYPIVVLDRTIECPYIESIAVNNSAPMADMVQGLVDRNYRNFAFLGGPEQTDDNKERYGAFLDVLSKNSIPFSRENYFSGDYRERSGGKAARIIMFMSEKPDVLVCANDNMAIGAIRCFREMGLRVPEDIGVTGFDDCELAKILGLTTVSIPNFERGYLAARRLIENIHGKRGEEKLIINPLIKWRKTVRQ